MSAFGKQAADTRRCVFCGKGMAAHLTQCPFCREAVPQVQLSRRSGPDGGTRFAAASLHASRRCDPLFRWRLRRSLTDSSAGPRPSIRDAIPDTADFPRGLGLTLYGLFLRIRS